MNDKITRFDRYRYNLLWLAEHFFYSKKANQARRKLGASLSKKIPEELGGLGDHGENHIPVPVIDGTNIEEFIENYRDKSHPVVLKNVASSWPLFKKWNPDFFSNQYPEDPVILFDAAIENSKRAYTEGKKTKSVSLSEFIESMKNGGKDYARLLPLLDQHPELLEDMDVNWLRAAANNGSKKSIKHQLFIGGAGTSTSMHCAIGSNLFIQVHGRKQWWIYSNKNAPLLDPIVDRSVFFRSQVNSENPEDGFKKADGWTVVLEPGDILYNPPFFWHQARGLDTNMGVGFRWFSLASILKVSPAQFLMTLTASNPSVREANKVKHNFAKVYAELLEKQTESK
jgi:ribosomal protein L16 Arg81 hydroxylase